MSSPASPNPAPAPAKPAPAWTARAAVALGLLLLLALVVPLCRRSINLSDEGYLLLQSLDMLQGKVLYRDMDAFVSPGIWFLLAGLFSIVEPSVLASRLLAGTAFLATVAVAVRIVTRFGPPIWGALCALLFAIFVVWAFPIWTFAFYSPFAVLLALAGLERLLAWRSDASPGALFASGVCFGLAIVFKQNYGVFATVGALAGLVAIYTESRLRADDARSAILRPLGLFTLGGLAVGVPLVLYFTARGAFGAMFESLVIHPFVFAGQHSVAYLGPAEVAKPDLLADADRLTYGAYSLYNTAVPTDWLKQSRIIERLHVVLYQIPIVTFAGAAWFSLRPPRPSPATPSPRFDAGLFSVLAVCGMLFLGVFPRADYNHLINLYQPVIVVTVIVLQRIASTFPAPRPIWLRGLASLGCVLLLAYAAVAANWYHEHIRNMNTPVDVRRGGVLVRPERAMRLSALVEIIWKYTDPGETLLTVPDISMVNFLAEREMPSPYYNLYQHHIAHDGGQSVVDGSEAHQTRLALTRYSDFFSDRDRLRNYAPALTDHLDRSYEIKVTAAADTFLFLLRRPTPLPRRETLRVLEHCSVTPESGDHDIKPHLLFSTLYQDRGAHHGENDHLVETRCAVHVPESGAELRFRVDTLPPLAARPRSTLTTEIVVEREAESRLVFHHNLPVFHPYGLQMIRQWPPEHRVDLSAFAGEDITLVFRSHRRGWVRTDPYSYKGYSTLWLGPQLIANSPAATHAPSASRAPSP